jgi:ABC-type antimicrobial peptide transport system permease subunit
MNADQAFVNDSFFATMGIALMSGVSFGRTDQPTGLRTAVVSESVARTLSGSSGIVGRTIRVGPNPVNQAVTVIGVARDAVLSNPQRRNPNVVYLNFWQFGQPIQGYATLLVRTAQHITVSANALQRAVREGGYEYVSLTYTLPGLRDAALVQERLLATLSTAFAVMGLTLAAVGLYGLLSFSIAQRTSELGIRIALGATRARILGLVIRESAMMMVVGTLIGLPIAWAANRTAAALLYSRVSVGVMPGAVAVALMAVVGCGGVWFPARRATRVDPLVALRHDN